MTLPIFIFFAIVTVLAPMVGKYIAWVFDTKPSSRGNKVSVGIRAFLNYFWRRRTPDGHVPKWVNRHDVLRQQTWKEYFLSLMIFNLVCIISTFLIIFYQKYLPTGKDVPHNINFAASVNAAISFATGTFWQSHNPEQELSLFSQIFALTMQNFLSAATGIAVFIAFVRGIINNNNPCIGNFYNDFLRSMFFILLPISFLIALFLISGSVPHDFTGIINYANLEGARDELFVGPIAGQAAIKHFAVNGGSLLASSSAHPFEAPSRLVIMFELFLIVIMPVALIFTYGYCVKALNFSWSLYGVVVFVMVSSLYVLNLGETTYSIPLILGNGGLEDNFNYTGKELIYDKFPSLMWVLSITMSSDGSPNACLENYSPLSTFVLFSNLVMSKFIMEGVGSGFFAMLAYLIAAVFLRGLITGNSTNFFGKKITINEINYVIIVFLIMPIGVLLFTGITFLIPGVKEIIIYSGSQAVTDIAYNFASSFTNNGSDFSGINTSNDYFNYMTALAMFIGRYPVIYYSLAISGSFACKQKISTDIGTHKQSSLELSFFLLITVLIVGAIMFMPLMILGPLLEFMSM